MHEPYITRTPDDVYHKLANVKYITVVDFKKSFWQFVLDEESSSGHTCETAIYHEKSPDLIKDKCNIQYYPELDPTPQILDAGKHISLGNIPEPWSVVCSKNDPIPNPLQASKYVIIKKRIYVSVLLVQVHGIYKKILFIVKRKLVVIYSYITL